MPIQTCQKQYLPHHPCVMSRQLADGGLVPGAEPVWEAAVGGAEAGEELGAVAGVCGEGEGERAWAGDGFLYEEREHEHSVDVA